MGGGDAPVSLTHGSPATRTAAGEMPASVVHGRASTYGNWSCRCPECCAAWSLKMRKYRQREAARLKMRPCGDALFVPSDGLRANGKPRGSTRRCNRPAGHEGDHMHFTWRFLRTARWAAVDKVVNTVESAQRRPDGATVAPTTAEGAGGTEL
jgi:hypothetical protein